jgi:hypothetical protein
MTKNKKTTLLVEQGEARIKTNMFKRNHGTGMTLRRGDLDMPSATASGYSTTDFL